MALFRSEPMARCQLYLQSEAAYNCVSELGELGLVQFVDLNPDVSLFQRKFVSEIKRCEELERKLRYVEKEMNREGVQPVRPAVLPRAPPPRDLTDLEISLGKMERDLSEVTGNSVALKKNHLELMELMYLLNQADLFLSESSVQIADSDQVAAFDDVNLLEIKDESSAPSMKFHMVSGVIPRAKYASFERLLWRICKGNVFIKSAPIEEKMIHPETGDPMDKSVFMVFFQGEQLNSRVRKVCEGFHATVYPCPERSGQRKEMLQNVRTRIEDLNTVLHETEEHRCRLLCLCAGSLRQWYVKVRKIKAIYFVLNMFSFDVTQRALVAECWMPELDIPSIQDALQRGAESSGSSIPPILNKVAMTEHQPTFNRVDKFTAGFQHLIDAYGPNTYREVNPAAFTIATFPFLFAVMFGDVGHGFIMLLFAIWMVVCEHKLVSMAEQNEIFNIFFGGRYIILLMGMFSMYTGLIYNDCFSRSLNLFGSHWTYPSNFTFPIQLHETIMLDPGDRSQYKGDPYYLGIDAAWQFATNKITFLNSYKMKISLIFGLSHMVFGVMLSLWNQLNRKQYSHVLLEFIPRLVFLVFIFFYLIFMIFFKWATYYADTATKATNTRSEHCAPNLLITFINMMLFKEDPTDEALRELCQGHEVYMYPGQAGLQKFLVITGALMVPVMLFGKPIHIFIQRRRNRHYQRMPEDSLLADSSGEDDVAVVSGGGDSHNEEELPLSEVMIYQAIHTIEYVLESVSHTASYLRLWALSLAHSQLSEVLWNMVMAIALTGFGKSYVASIVLYFIFAAWAALTISILVLMEGLSAFLHTLRLHWVEFQSKFYDGQGVLFVPFNFKEVLKEAEAGDKELLKAAA